MLAPFSGMRHRDDGARRAFRRRLAPLIIGVLAAAALPRTAIAQDGERCGQIRQAIESAAEARNLDELRIQLDLAKSATACGPSFAYCLGRRAALAHLDEVYARVNAGMPEAQAKPLLERALALGAPWQVAFVAGEAEEASGAGDRARFERAAKHYQVALDDLGQEPECAGEKALRPDAEQAQAIYRRAVIAYLLSPSAVEPPRNRCGEEAHAWLFVGSVCGFEPTGRPLPLQFVYRETTLTPKGQSTAELLLDHLKRTQAPKITLIGHTDAKGSDRYNLRLSAQRLEALAKLLKDGGYQGEIALEPKGESEPYPLDEPQRYSADEIDEINRRVEFRLGE